MYAPVATVERRQRAGLGIRGHALAAAGGHRPDTAPRARATAGFKLTHYFQKQGIDTTPVAPHSPAVRLAPSAWWYQARPGPDEGRRGGDMGRTWLTSGIDVPEEC